MSDVFAEVKARVSDAESKIQATLNQLAKMPKLEASFVSAVTNLSSLTDVLTKASEQSRSAAASMQDSAIALTACAAAIANADPSHIESLLIDLSKKLERTRDEITSTTKETIKGELERAARSLHDHLAALEKLQRQIAGHLEQLAERQSQDIVDKISSRFEQEMVSLHDHLAALERLQRENARHQEQFAVRQSQDIVDKITLILKQDGRVEDVKARVEQLASTQRVVRIQSVATLVAAFATFVVTVGLFLWRAPVP